MNLYRCLRPISEFWIKFRLSGDWRGVRFLCYHSVVDDRCTMHPGLKDLSVTTKEFKNHLAYFHQYGPPVISMKSAMELLETREAQENKYVCLTFDDRDMDHYSVSWKIIKEFGLQAHFFVVSNFIGKTFVSEYDGREWARTFMGKDEIKAIVKELVDYFNNQASAWFERYHKTQQTNDLLILDRMNIAIEFIRSRLVQGSRIFDVGCGPGVVSLHLAQQDYRINGIDISPNMIKLCQKTFAEMPAVNNKHTFTVGNFIETDFDKGSFDGIVALGFLEFQENEIIFISGYRS